MPQGHAACAQPKTRASITALVNREIVVPAIISRGDASDQRVMLGTRCDLRLDGDNRALRDIDRFKALPIIVVSN